MTDSPTPAAPIAPPEGNPAAPGSARGPGDVVTPELVARLTRGLPGGTRTVSHTPLTGERLAEYPEASPDDVAEAFRAARTAQRGWAATPVRKRAGVLLGFHD